MYNNSSNKCVERWLIEVSNLWLRLRTQVGNTRYIENDYHSYNR